MEERNDGEGGGEGLYIGEERESWRQRRSRITCGAMAAVMVRVSKT